MVCDNYDNIWKKVAVLIILMAVVYWSDQDLQQGCTSQF